MKASYYFRQGRHFLKGGKFEDAIDSFTYLIEHRELECYDYFASDRGFRLIASCAIGNWDIANEDILLIPDDYIMYIKSINEKIDKSRLLFCIENKKLLS